MEARCLPMGIHQRGMKETALSWLYASPIGRRHETRLVL